MLLRTILTYGMETSLSIALLVLILATLFIQRARKYGLVISHIYAIIVGLLSYATFTTYMQNLGPEVL